ncbi:PAPA-1 domain-containing protein [Citrus sinensis]|nr:PAPA-1 domain-containing protein [Citrus sinensis]
MEDFRGLRFSNATGARKKRSNISRRPWNDLQPLSDFRDLSSFSSTPPSENVSMQKCNMGNFGAVSDGLGNENKVKKVKLKVGGITRTINAKSAQDGSAGAGSTRLYHYSDTQQPRQKLIIQEVSDDNRSISSDNRDSLQGSTWKDSSESDLRAEGSRSRIPYENIPTRQTEKYESVRKSKRVPKKRSLDGVFDDTNDVDDDEIRYLEKVKKSKVNTNYGAQYEDDKEGGSRKQRKISRVLKKNVDVLYEVNAGEFGSSKLGKDGKKLRSGRVSEDTDYLEEEEPLSDGEPEIKKKKTRKEFIDLLGDSKKEMTVTTRQRALQTGKDVTSGAGASLLEFPNGLPPVPPKKQKEKLSEVEQQLKRAEALQRRRMQVEKAARESEAEAIRKILGQDSNRKKREDKMKKRQEELAQKAANAMVLASDTIRWTMGPSGTTVTFPSEVGLPSLFDHKPSSYPPPREKCAAPSCTNPYKYRDSKSKLPLCSLQCYKAINEKMPPVSAC